ncbi:MAG: sugar ABC transporter permease [Oscillospiraceae bacterium]|nr:sugar ABC transporter permease [Oscillospiraceae bacterium]
MLKSSPRFRGGVSLNRKVVTFLNEKDTVKKSALDKFFQKDAVSGYVFIMPWLLGFLLFTLIPFVASFWFSFTKYDLFSSPKFIGLNNYIKMFTNDGLFVKSLKVTFLYAFASVPLRLIFALFVAILLNRKSKLSGLYRTLFYLPSIIGGSVAVAVMWRMLFLKEGGVFNAILGKLGLPDNISWLTNTKTAIWILVLLAVWQFGSSMLIFLAGLKQIPEHYYEAARVDGAGHAVQFFKITLPMLTPVIFFNLVNQLISGFIAFTQSVIITKSGEPLNTTLFYAVYLYRCSFGDYKMGYGSALAWVLLFIIAAFTAIIFKSSDSWVYYESKEQ